MTAEQSSNSHYRPPGLLEMKALESLSMYINVRLVGGTGSCSGTVEVYYRGQWGTVCDDDDWDINDGDVVCRQMGCGRALSVHGSAHFGQGFGPTLLDNVHCSGSERSITECRQNRRSRNYCGMWQSSQHHS
uniref:SRCR domain-containing protein n=1 Tax=Astyanax mexicanus TaxID=7994 RepID=A0A8B9J772_ASTMX